MALDAVTGTPLEGFGQPVPIDGFPETGVVDCWQTLATRMILMMAYP